MITTISCREVQEHTVQNSLFCLDESSSAAQISARSKEPASNKVRFSRGLVLVSLHIIISRMEMEILTNDRLCFHSWALIQHSPGSNICGISFTRSAECL